MAKGRTVPAEKLYDFTFPDTGRTVQIRKISTLLRAEVRRQVIGHPDFAKPNPPMSDVDYGNGTVTIPNPAHPIYQQLLRDWTDRVNEEIGNRLRNIIINRAVVAPEVDTDAVKQMRADAADIGSPLDAYSDHYVYVAFVCIGSEQDYAELVRAAYERSAPQEAAVQAHIDTFQPDVQGEAALQ